MNIVYEEEVMENKESNKFLGEEKVSKLLLKFAVPCIFSLLISSLYNIVDQIFIGNSDLGYLGNAATTIVFPITIISMAFAWCFGDGAAAYLSICQGKKDTENAHKSIGNSIIATLISGIVFLIVCLLLMDKLLYWFGASEATIGLARDYFLIILIATPINMLASMSTSIIRADGSPMYSMTSTLTGAVINIILDPIFIFVFNWGIKGAAYATIIGQIVSFFIAFSYFFKTKTFKLQKESFKPNFHVFSSVSKLGISTFITQISIVVMSLVCNIMLVKYGTLSKYGQDIPIAVIGIAMKVFTIVINIIVGLIVGGQPILGYNYGAKKYGRVKELFKIVSIITIIIGIIATLVFELCPQIIINIFGSESELYNEFAILTFRIFLSLVMFTCFVKMVSIFFQAVGQPVKATIISLIRDIICFIPLIIILPHFMGINGVLVAAPIADTVGMILTIVLVTVFLKSLGKDGVGIDNDAVIKQSRDGVIVTIAREHGSQGKYIGSLVADRLKIPYYYKELTALAAKDSGLDQEFIDKIDENSTNTLYDLYLSTSPVQYAIQAQEKVIKKIAESGSCVIVGRAADYVLRKNTNIVRVFIYAPKDYRISKVMEMYGDNETKAKKSISKSDKARSLYYKSVSGLEWGKSQNYDICINSAIGPDKTADIICEYIEKINKKRIK